ncbi:mRNA interferase MazF [Desulfofundulus australicus DSM 11792]|jgi:mRNA interferase MazF|uniref:mRNA interferase MazF n=1 Tax=Desulfofundulus australicus DSM 11792 TaxID=1121425 RepID=A0A1M4S8Q9_9FIRM|nr:type II toxin-antitoxin system PemK/MazF family toxin [Desulfofundulus australicus]SHE28548.1 mRNA interferase MazF [Desulfofundulus australicus DSM 11792]
MPAEIPRPGDIYRVSLEGTGHILRGSHYAVVVSDEPFNYLSTVVIVPLSTGARPASFRPELTFHGKVTRALPDQIRAVDKRRLKDFQGNVASTSFFMALQASLQDLLALN